MSAPETDLWAGFDSEAAEELTGPVWDEPVLLKARRDLPAFPVEALPDWLGNMVAAVAEETQTPTDLAGCLALSVIATAAGGRATVCVRGRWREPVNLYTAVALDPGNRKSAVFALMTEPLMAVEKALVELSGPARAEAETTAKLAKAAADKAAAKAANAEPDKREALTAEAVALAQQAEEMKVPCKPQLVADDVTPENLATLLTEQDGRISVLSPEGGIFDIIAGRYSGAPNMEIFLKGHAGDMVRVNRQGRDAQHIERPAVTMGLAVQPEVLESIGTIKGADGRGLLARFLYAQPESLVGNRNLTPDLIPDDVAQTYALRLGGLAMAMADWTDPAVLTL
ncbi:YfjI family protein, partial [Streptomyces sp. NPDC101150]